MHITDLINQTVSPTEVVEAVLAWLSRPGGRQSYDRTTDTCRYLAPDGNRCAVGILLTDYECHQFEGQPATDVFRKFLGVEQSTVLSGYNDFCEGLLDVLQDVHDLDKYWPAGEFDIEHARRTVNEYLA